jgi:DNA-binding response OmpR family regulator
MFGRDIFMRMLIVDAAPRVELLRRAMADEGYIVEVCRTGANGCRLATVDEYDVIMLARVLPDGECSRFCRDFRDRGVQSRLLVYSDDESPEEAARVLDSGADACLVQPWRNLELLAAKIRALLRRNHESSGNILRFGDLEMDLTRRVVRRANEKIALTRKEFELLHVFMHHPDRVISRTCIGVRVWGDFWDIESNVVDVCLSSLRRKIKNGSNRAVIRTIRGFGYMLTTEHDDDVGSEVSPQIEVNAKIRQKPGTNTGQ